MQALDFPVIVYHHGSQGTSDENVRMAEHFAANGFVFLSCNFHWPLEGAMYGTPLVWEPDESSILTMLRFASQLANINKTFYIGHSWGAQEGWCTLYEPDLVDAFVSLETTMEWKTDTAEVRDKWPHMLEAITTKSYPMPILLVADTEGEPPFPLFSGVRGELHYLDPKKPFAHECYTSAYLLRLRGQARFNVPDAEALREQEVVYDALLDELLHFLRAQAGMSSVAPVYQGGDPFHRK
ncbi:MAG: alpha/beta fold hydrolase [Flavobacteriales bacterium]|nr:alpha/beta fold hydrolase [Flavobacteriales bacterium]